ncbi:MAG: hypothetical protein E6Q83_00020 [Thiothrix sp.]|nr:MAG: hypothetical protein E6Q83_00020 [Thiothrix sp.]
MPYKDQRAAKGGHADFVKNPDVQNFLAECDYLREPSEAEAQKIVATFSKAPSPNPQNIPRYVVASDASKSDTPINDKLPSTQVGYVKVSQVLIDTDSYSELINPNSRFVDPFKVAELHRNASPITFVLPGSNVRFKGAKSVKDGFRKAIFEQLSMDRSQGSSNRLVLSEILVEMNEGIVKIGETREKKGQCPSCGAEHDFSFTLNSQQQACPDCNEIVYVTDWLRLHEDVSDFGNNTSAITRMMNAVEHLLLCAMIKQIFRADPKALGNMAFVMDGPLAIFGQPAKLHARIMNFLAKINTMLEQLKIDPLLIVGLQKTGEVMDHINLLKKYLPNGVLRLLDDTYRYEYIKGNDAPSKNFGNETYYGQDFIFKTESGRVFNFAIPYTFANKAESVNFSKQKADPLVYGNNIAKACQLIRHFELDLYESAIVPVALAHRHASISIMPGGHVLDILTKTGLQKNHQNL